MVTGEGPSIFFRVYKRMLLSGTVKQAAYSIVLEVYEDAVEDVQLLRGHSLGLPPAQAQDLTQDVFLKAVHAELRDGQEFATFAVCGCSEWPITKH